MAQTADIRAEKIRDKLAKVKSEASSFGRKKDPWRTFGAFKDDADFDEAVRLGREYREQQTYEKELAGS